MTVPDLADLFARPADDGRLIFGRPHACPHCGAIPEPRTFFTPRGTEMTAHFPSDTCCRERARQVYEANKLWSARYRNLAGLSKSAFVAAEYRREAKELELSNVEIKRVMDARKAEEGRA